MPLTIISLNNMNLLNKIKAFIVHKTKMLYLILNGIPFSTARYFAGWEGFERIDKVKRFAVSNGFLQLGESRLPTSVIGITQNNIHTLLRLIEEFNFRYENGSYLLCLQGFDSNQLTFEVIDHGSLVAFFDVFISNSYYFNGPKQCIVVDVGTNVGLAAIMFALRSDVQSVFTYEIVPSTYQVALRNFARNPTIEKKITSYNFGLAENEGEFWIHSPISNSATFSLENVPNILTNSDQSQKLITRNAGIELADLIKEINCDNTPLVLKMDCEGAELGILRSMFAHNILEKFSIVMLEWHFGNFTAVEKLLLNNDFILFGNGQLSSTNSTGMIYAVKPPHQS